MKVLIIGLGSIAKKHIAALRKLDKSVIIYALRSSKASVPHVDVIDVFEGERLPQFDFSIISNPTSEHYKTIYELLSIGRPMFIEKPLFSSLEGGQKLVDEVLLSGTVTYIGCNLRFHPVIGLLNKKFTQTLPIELNVYSGSYLPNWRPGIDYRENYSARVESGGGAHLDLIHDIDYCTHLLGSPDRLWGFLRKKSRLEIDSVDCAHYVLEYPSTSVFITLNYYRRDSKREIECVWEDETWKVDLLKNQIIDEKGEIIYYEPYHILDTYERQMGYFIDCLKNNQAPMNGINEAFEVLKICLSNEQLI